MPPPIEPSTVMFADLVGSTRIYEILGDAVNLASRLSDLAKQRQILITRETAEELELAADYWSGGTKWSSTAAV